MSPDSMWKTTVQRQCRMCDRLPRALLGAGLFALTALPICSGPAIIRFNGAVKRGDSFQHKVSDGLIFGLDPTKESDPCQGWQIWLGPSEQIKAYAAIATTPLFHGLIDTDICGSDFRNSDNSGPNTPGPKNVNRPQRVRHFEFVTNQSDYEAVVNAYDALNRNALTAEQVSSQVLQYHHTGKLNITGFSLRRRAANDRADGVYGRAEPPQCSKSVVLHFTRATIGRKLQCQVAFSETFSQTTDRARRPGNP